MAGSGVGLGASCSKARVTTMGNRALTIAIKSPSAMGCAAASGGGSTSGRRGTSRGTLADGVILNGGGTSSMESQLELAYRKREDE